jgi:hypothetical protein
MKPSNKNSSDQNTNLRLIHKSKIKEVDERSSGGEDQEKQSDLYIASMLDDQLQQ